MKNKKGFTLAELLIVVAIIGVLVAVSIPIFTSQLEKSKQATDLANMRSAKAAAVAEWMMGPMSETETYVYDAASGKVYSKGTMTPSGYGKSSHNATEFASMLNAEGTPNKNGTPTYLTVTVTTDGSVTMVWGSGMTFASISGGTAGADNFAWGQNQFVQDAKQALVASDNNQRLAQDKEVIYNLASYFSEVSDSELQKILGSTRYNKVSKGQSSVLFEYQVNNQGVVDFVNFDTAYQPYFSELGYDAQFIKSTWGPVKNESNYISDTSLQTGSTNYNYVDKYLFTSQEMIGDMNSGSKKQVWIQYSKDSEGNYTIPHIWVSGVSDLDSNK